jgi:hypothetical protein
MTGNVALDVTKYTITTLNIISSNKINQKTTQIQRLLGLLPPSGKDVIFADQSSKAGKNAVVAISAKAQVASKLITVVEILKREVAKWTKERAVNGATEHKSLKLFQYSNVTTTTIEVKPKPAKQEKSKKVKDVPALKAEGTSEAAKESEQSKKRKRLASSQDSTAGDRSPVKKAKTLDETTANAEEDDNASEEEDDFEVAAAVSRVAGSLNQKTGLTEVENELKQEREVSVLTVYVSLTAIPDLAEAYGEQTS